MPVAEKPSRTVGKEGLALFLLLACLLFPACSPCPEACQEIYLCLGDEQWVPASCIPRCKEVGKLARANGYEKAYQQFLTCARNLPAKPLCTVQFQQCAAEIPEWIWLKAGFRTRK